MANRDSLPILLRLKRLEEKAKASSKKGSVTFIKDPTKVISVAAFIISIGTTIFAWRKENIEAQIAQRRQLDATMQQMVDIGFKNFDFLEKNRNSPNINSMSGWFYSQTGMLAQKAAQELALSEKGSLLDYLFVGNALLEANQATKAMDLFQRAVKLGEAKQAEEKTLLHRSWKFVERTLYGEDIEQAITDEQRPHHMASAHSAVGMSLIAQDKPKEAELHFNKAILAMETSNSPEYYKKQVIAVLHKTWGETLARFNHKNCTDIKAQLEKAEQLFPDNLKNGNFDWNMIQSEVGWLRSNCLPDGTLFLAPAVSSFQPGGVPQAKQSFQSSAAASAPEAAPASAPDAPTRIQQSSGFVEQKSAPKHVPRKRYQ